MSSTAFSTTAFSTTASSTTALACELVRRASITPDDAGCQALIAERLTALGFDCVWMPRNAVTNLWARRGNTAPLVCFAGHTDVVPPGPLENWRSDPFTPALVDGQLCGRGIADMKGGIAAFITALERFIAAHPDVPGSLAVLLTSDEEGDAVDGTAHVVEQLARRGEAPDYCIIGEPSSHAVLGDTLKNGRRGSLSGALTVHGIQGHIAYPQLADNPIHALTPALAELIATRWDEGNADFPPTSFQCSNIHAGTGATNMIPGALTLNFNFRHSTESTAESLKERVAHLLKKHDLKYTLTWQPASKPFLTVRGALLDAANAALTDVLGAPAQTSCEGGTSDGRFLADICPQLIELGLTNASIHQANECVPIKDLDRLSAVYERLLERLFGLVDKPQ
ncbi:MAG: succinyl-diaminopimelate desuccinylase [Proteobacteria bacterium]|nr:succinyl-diaminopimelate desuccinylase [Pseudomonadota bacterium]